MIQSTLEYRHESDTLDACAAQLNKILEEVPAKLRAFNEDEFSSRPQPGKWSRKEIIGHLIDSATNNHHRFIRAQFDDKPRILYDQEKWNEHGCYAQMDGNHLITFWELYNRHLVELIRMIPSSLLERECMMGDGTTRTIRWLFEDYVRHLEHHLRQIFDENLTW